MSTPYAQSMLEITDPVARITLARTARLNAMTTRILAEIRLAFAAAARDERVVGSALPLGPAMADTGRLMNESLERADFRDGVRLFVEQRPPVFARMKI